MSDDANRFSMPFDEDPLYGGSSVQTRPPADGATPPPPHLSLVPPSIPEVRTPSEPLPPLETLPPLPSFEAPPLPEAAPPKAAFAPAPEPEDGGFSAIDLRDRVAIMLLFNQLVEVEQIESAWHVWKQQEAEGKSEALWRVIAREPGVNAEVVYREAATIYAFKEANFIEDEAVEFVTRIEEWYTKEQWHRMQDLTVMPIELLGKGADATMVFATYDPTSPDVPGLVKTIGNGRYELQYANRAAIEEALAKAFPQRNEFLERIEDGSDMAFDLGTSFQEEEEKLLDEDALEAEISRSSLLNLFEATLVEGVRRGTSDIHIIPNPNKQIEIHFRVDGELQLWHREERIHPESFIAVVKDNSLNVDRFERDMARDGFIQRKIDGTLIRFRVSIIPVASAAQDIKAESIVLRILDDRKVVTDLRKLGLLDVALERFEDAIRQPHGMVILTGPTGSGKSTTLFASLYQVISPKKNVLTVEDPVEYLIPGVRQIKLSHKLSLEQAIRAILRHDPDIVMVGEMRDRPTAELAIKLANTGHLTFSTLHTNDAPSAVSRLYKMGVEPFLIAYAINLVVAQRLIRKLCTECKVVDDDPDRVLLKKMGFTEEEAETTTFYKAGHRPSCPKCKGIGYKGRRAITETMRFSREIRHLIVESETKIDEDAIRDAALRDGMLTLNDSAKEIVKLGDTSVEEMLRVTAGGH
ncbi:MAG: GspE/PulE family protein [Bacteroidota bacterium]